MISYAAAAWSWVEKMFCKRRIVNGAPGVGFGGRNSRKTTR